MNCNITAQQKNTKLVFQSKDYKLTLRPQQNVFQFKFQGIINQGTSATSAVQTVDKEAMSNLFKGNLVYVDVVNGKVGKTFSPSINATRYIGMAQSSINLGFVGKIQLEGILELTDWTAITGSVQLTIGSKYYLSELIAGTMSLAPPTTGWQVTAGTALSSTQFLIQTPQIIKI